MGETGPGKALVLSGGREKDGFGFFADTRGEEEELVLGVLCLSLGRLNVLCTKLLRTERTGKYKSWRAVYSSFLFFFSFFLFPSAASVVPVFVVAVLVVSGSCLLTLCEGVVSYNLFLL